MEKYMWFQNASMGIYSGFAGFWAWLIQLEMEDWFIATVVLTFITVVIFAGIVACAIVRTVHEVMEKVDGDTPSDELITPYKD